MLASSAWWDALSGLLQWLRALVAGQRVLALGGRRLAVTGALGQGATCAVHCARDARSGERFAVKEMLRASLADVRREIEAHLAVRHDHVLPLLAWQVVPEGGGGGGGGSAGAAASFASSPAAAVAAQHQLLLPAGGDEEQCSALLLFPLALQGSLADAIAAALRPQGAHVGLALSEGEALRHCAGLARGLCALHASGRSHRDVNPRNALLLGGGGGGGGGGSVAVLADLGSAGPLRTPVGSRLEALRAGEEAAQRTSMPYRAPEQWQCDARPGSELCGARADVWALGCTLYACLWGVSPFECVGGGGGGGGGVGLRLCEPCHSRVLGEAVFPPSALPSAGVVQLIAACLQRDPQARPSMREVAERMEGLLRQR